MKLSLAMIVRNNERSIGECLSSVLPWVDELCVVDTGSTDATVEVIQAQAEQHGVPLNLEFYRDPAGHPKWISNFSVPRNMSFDLCTGDMILWLDSDDVLAEMVGDGGRLSGESLRDTVKRECSGEPSGDRVDAYYLRYDYGHDAVGNVTVRQQRLRIVRNGYFKWVYPVHEVLVPVRPANLSDDMHENEFWVVHAGNHSSGNSAERNLWIIRSWREAGEEMDIRLWKGEGDALRTLGHHQEAIEAYNEVLELAPLLSDDRYLALVRRGDSRRILGRYEDAMDDYGRAARAHPQFSLAHLAMAEAQADMQMWGQALVSCDMADRADGDRESLLYNPVARVSVTNLVRGKAYLALEEYEKARVCWMKLNEMYPGDPELEAKARGLDEAIRQRDLYEAFCALADESEDPVMLAKAAPKCLGKFPRVGRLVRPERPAGKPVIAIWCGETTNLWGPGSIEEGTGGSEESAIYMSRYLTKLGYHVEVYGTPKTEDLGVDEHGVVWMNASFWKPGDEADIFIAWRNTSSITLADNCPQKWIWLQDIPQSEWYTKEFCEMLDGILCISRLQASFLGEHGESMATISANGLEPEMYVDGPNLRNQFIYASSPDRGLVELLGEWPRIRDSVPGAKLHVFYGFRDVYMHRAERNPESLELKRTVEAALEADETIINHGMVGQPELHRWFSECGFWLYPTSFEEAFCITAAKAQALGAIPVTSRHLESSLPEVCGEFDMGPEPDHGRIREDREWLTRWTDRVIELANRDDDEINEHRKRMKAYARERFPWSKVADQWHSLFSDRSRSEETPGRNSLLKSAT